jgi:hypothetical protein
MIVVNSNKQIVRTVHVNVKKISCSSFFSFFLSLFSSTIDKEQRLFSQRYNPNLSIGLVCRQIQAIEAGMAPRQRWELVVSGRNSERKKSSRKTISNAIRPSKSRILLNETKVGAVKESIEQREGASEQYLIQNQERCSN